MQKADGYSQVVFLVRPSVHGARFSCPRLLKSVFSSSSPWSALCMVLSHMSSRSCSATVLRGVFFYRSSADEETELKEVNSLRDSTNSALFVYPTLSPAHIATTGFWKVFFPVAEGEGLEEVMMCLCAGKNASG